MNGDKHFFYTFAARKLKNNKYDIPQNLSFHLFSYFLYMGTAKLHQRRLDRNAGRHRQRNNREPVWNDPNSRERPDSGCFQINASG